MENISPSDIEKTRRLLQNNGYLSGRLINFSSVKSIRKLIYLGFQTNLTLARFRCFKGYFSIISVGDSTMKTPFYRHLATPRLFFSCSTRARPIRAQEKLHERALTSSGIILYSSIYTISTYLHYPNIKQHAYPYPYAKCPPISIYTPFPQHQNVS